ncbi:MAG: hypothetical protein QXX20_04095 [Candidatus Thermoplasmatota archaeon]
MHRVDVMYEIEQENLAEDIYEMYKIKTPKDRIKSIKITEKVFELMRSEGMLQKTDDGYVFVGKYDELKEFKKKKKH